MCFSARNEAPARSWNVRPRKSESAAASHCVVARKSIFTAVNFLPLELRAERIEARP
jgi:hypothetical protein